MKGIDQKVDGISSLSAAEFNPNQSELENAVETAGQTLDPTGTDLNQLGEAISMYASGGGDFYKDNGSGPNVYDLAGLDSFRKPGNYFEGMSVRFYAGFTNNSGALITVNGISQKDLVKVDGSDLIGGEIIAGSLIRAIYDGTDFKLTSLLDLSSPPAIGDITPNTVKATTFEGDVGGNTINEFSVDDTMAGNSDDAVPTEQAVKDFVEINNVADQSEMEATTDITKKVTPGLQQHHPGMAKAWVSFDGTTLGADSVQSIHSSYNIEDVKRSDGVIESGKGQFIISFDVDFINNDYVFVGFARDDNSGGDYTVSAQSTTTQPKNNGSVLMSTVAADGSRVNPTEVNLVFFGNQ